MIKRFLFTLFCILVGSIFGIFTAYFILIEVHNFKNYTRDGWYSNSPALKNLDNPYILAKYALNHDIYLETNDDIIFKADKDQNGTNLNTNCIYKLTNLDLPCSFFTIYTEDETGTNYAKLVKEKNPKLANMPYQLNSQTLLKYYASNLNNITLAPITHTQSNNWLATPTYGDYTLVLTMHNLTFLRTQISSFSLPKIQKISCSIFQ